MAMVIVSPSKSAMVRLMPSMATEPLCTIHGRTFSGTRTLSVQSVVSRLNAGLAGEMTGSREASTPAAVHVALNNVSAEGTAGGGGQFEVDLGAGSEGAKRGLVERFLGEVGVEEGRVHVERGEADAGDAERIAFAQPAGQAGSFDGDAADAATVFQADERAGLFDDAGEHGLILKEQWSVVSDQ